MIYLCTCFLTFCRSGFTCLFRSALRLTYCAVLVAAVQAAHLLLLRARAASRRSLLWSTLWTSASSTSEQGIGGQCACVHCSGDLSFSFIMYMKPSFSRNPFFGQTKVKVKIFRFCPKTMDYNKAFWPKSRSLFVVLLLQNERCYEAEICAILLLLRCPFRWNPFLPKSKLSDFGQKPWTIIRRFGRNRGHSLWSFYILQNGRCYEAEICAILLLLRPWTIVRRFYQFLYAPITPRWKVLRS